MLAPNNNCKCSPNMPSKLIVLFFQETVSQHERASKYARETLGDDDIGEQVLMMLVSKMMKPTLYKYMKCNEIVAME